MRGKWNTEAKFWARAKRVNGCLEWQGNLFKTGYGRIHFQRKLWRAHRLSWTLTNGPIPPNLFVCHHCDNPRCIDPIHLFLGTRLDNDQDRWAKGRTKLSGKPGEQHSSARLTNQQVREIRLLLVQGVGQRELGRRYGVTHSSIRKIQIGKTWAHLP